MAGVEALKGVMLRTKVCARKELFHAPAYADDLRISELQWEVSVGVSGVVVPADLLLVVQGVDNPVLTGEEMNRLPTGTYLLASRRGINTGFRHFVRRGDSTSVVFADRWCR